MSTRFSIVCFAWMLAVACTLPCLSQETTGEKPVEKPVVPAVEKPAAPGVDELVEQLDSNKFSDRQAASQKLAEAGKSAIPALGVAAQTESREASTRAIEILKNHFQKGDEATKAAAKDTLEKIAKGQNPAAARRAEEALTPKLATALGAPGFPGGIQIVPGNIQIQVQGIAGRAGVKRINMKNINGVKEIDIDDNGKKVKIHDDPNNGIKIEVTEKNKDGKEETKKYEAKNADELKKNHPDGHKIYEEYSKQPGGIQIQGIQIQNGVLPPNIFPRPVPGIPGVPGTPGVPAIPRAARPIRIRPAPEAPPANEKIDAAQKRLDEAAESLKKLAKNNPQAEEIAKLADLIEAAKKQLEEAKGQAEE